ncbi:MAG: hypothetical protein F2942_05125 [Actinobacteria bacterium]|uniref:Unannotated protein n=1 Tax=freshwater metagenome TaxID=449393 RepID=A0A6J6YP10_9ZZZZ|nr:hypothetical protein [Actinomycetota bacterium]MSX75114.1 hypothetical protein [Actinomycetota bacterium]MTA74082.1 hypothetical protein [Actinomycetota bacterium]
MFLTSRAVSNRAVSNRAVSKQARLRANSSGSQTKERTLLLLVVLSVLLAAQLSGCGTQQDTRNSGSIQGLPSAPPTSLTGTSRQAKPNPPEQAAQSSAQAAQQAAGKPPMGAGSSPQESAKPAESYGAEQLLVAQLLVRYSQIVTELAEHPDLASDPLSEQRVRLDALVPPQSTLSVDVLSQLVLNPAADLTRVIPASTGLSYSYRPLKVSSSAYGLISFTWCGYSPGVRVTQTSGEVLDDSVAQLQGTGSARAAGSDWVIDSLDHLEVTVLPPGSTDPCPVPRTAEARP